MTQDGKALVLIGGGGHAVVVAEAARSVGHDIAGVLDDALTPLACKELGLTRLGGLLDQTDTPAIVCVGDLRARRRAIESWRGSWGTVVHQSAAVPQRFSCGKGSFVGVAAILMPSCSVGDHAIINSGAIIEHHTAIGENTHIGPGAILGGGCRVGCDVLVGLGARVLPGATIGDGATVGAGAVVTADVPAGATAVGVPARLVAG